MSIEKSLWDIDNMADLVLDGLGPIKSIVSDFFGGDFFSGDGTYPAVVISKPVDISSSEYTALGFPNYDANSSRNYRKFKVRIINKRNNPHAMLENPCDLSTATELCQQNSLIASHTTVATNQTLGFGIGALVKIKLDKLPNSTFNLQTAHYLELLQPNDTGAQILSKVACDSMSLMFEHGENYEPPPEIVINSDLIEWADKYDAEPVPNKIQHAPFLRAIEARGKLFELHVKAFFYFVWKRKGYSIIITSGVRTQSKQTELYNKYQKCKDSGKTNCTPAGKKLGYHGAGLAIDINFNTNGSTINGKTGNIGTPTLMNQSKADNKDLWLASGIVDIAAEVGLEWGGNFSGRTGYDAPHFQWTPGSWTKKTVEQHAGSSAMAPVSTEVGSGQMGATEVAEAHKETIDTAEETFQNIADQAYLPGTSTTSGDSEIDENIENLGLEFHSSGPAHSNPFDPAPEPSTPVSGDYTDYTDHQD